MIGNGDVTTPEAAKHMIRRPASGISAGRGLLQSLDLFAHAGVFATGVLPPASWKDWVMRRHYDLMVEVFGSGAPAVPKSLPGIQRFGPVKPFNTRWFGSVQGRLRSGSPECLEWRGLTDDSGELYPLSTSPWLPPSCRKEEHQAKQKAIAVPGAVEVW